MLYRISKKQRLFSAIKTFELNRYYLIYRIRIVLKNPQKK